MKPHTLFGTGFICLSSLSIPVVAAGESLNLKTVKQLESRTRLIHTQQPDGGQDKPLISEDQLPAEGLLREAGPR